MSTFTLSPSAKWRTTYWRQGSQAAQDYSNQIAAERLQFSQNKIYSLCKFQIQEGFSREEAQDSFLKISCFYDQKQKKYCSDCKENGFSGRGVLGRTPLNVPSYAERFQSPQAIASFCDQKVKSHKEVLEAFNHLRNVLLLDDGAKKWVSESQKTHAAAMKKWGERKIRSLQSSSHFLRRDPLWYTGIDWAHKQGYLGEGGKCIVIEEDGADISHPSLFGAFLNFPHVRKGFKYAHATHICGLIAGKKNEAVGYQGGGVPKAKIELACKLQSDIFASMQGSSHSIVNFSGDFINPFAKLCYCLDNATEFANSVNSLLPIVSPTLRNQLLFMLYLNANGKNKELVESIQKLYKDVTEQTIGRFSQALVGKLLIAALGNEGITVSENPIAYFSSLVFPTAAQNEKTILVANVALNALGEVILSPCSNTPGAEFAHKTICAPGIAITSCWPENQFLNHTGTSMATPFVTSVAVAIQSAFPRLSIDQIKECILNGATPIILVENAQGRFVGRLVSHKNLKDYSPKWIAFSRRFFGMGLLNAQASIALARNLSF